MFSDKLKRKYIEQMFKFLKNSNSRSSIKYVALGEGVCESLTSDALGMGNPRTKEGEEVENPQF